MVRQRVEDLGRLSVMISNLLDEDLFSLSPRFEFTDHYFPKSLQENEDYEVYIERLNHLSGMVEYVADKLHACREIADGEDRLNQDPAINDEF